VQHLQCWCLAVGQRQLLWWQRLRYSDIIVVAVCGVCMRVCVHGLCCGVRCVGTVQMQCSGVVWRVGSRDICWSYCMCIVCMFRLYMCVSYHTVSSYVARLFTYHIIHYHSFIMSQLLLWCMIISVIMIIDVSEIVRVQINSYQFISVHINSCQFRSAFNQSVFLHFSHSDCIAHSSFRIPIYRYMISVIVCHIKRHITLHHIVSHPITSLHT